jgi:hypothetical protein
MQGNNRSSLETWIVSCIHENDVIDILRWF